MAPSWRRTVETVADRFIPFDPDHTLEDYLRCREEMLDEMIEAGDILEGQRGRVSFARWQTKDEAAEMKQSSCERSMQ
jgi:hypothetical protein